MLFPLFNKGGESRAWQENIFSLGKRTHHLPRFSRFPRQLYYYINNVARYQDFLPQILLRILSSRTKFSRVLQDFVRFIHLGIMNRPGDWNCRSCHHLNFQRRDSCQRCGDPRPGERGEYGGFGGRSGALSYGFTGPDVRPGDWYCSVGNCGAHNFASRSSCFKCGAVKDEASGGGSAFDGEFLRPRGSGFGGGGGSRSGWKSGDWICTRLGCNEHNFANRMECYKCNAPKEASSKSSF